MRLRMAGRAGHSGKRTFFVNQGGDVLATNGAIAQYGGVTAPAYGAAFIATGSNSMSAMIAANTLARDTNSWVVVQ